MTLTYGIDIDCGEDLDPLLRDVTGERLMAQAMLHRLETRPGMLLDDPTYGFGLKDQLSEETTATEFAMVCRRMEHELERDERVFSVKVSGTQTETDGAITWEFEIEGQGLAGPFALTIGVNDVTVELLNVGGVL